MLIHSYALPWRPIPVLSALGMNKQKVYLYDYERAKASAVSDAPRRGAHTARTRVCARGVGVVAHGRDRLKKVHVVSNSISWTCRQCERSVDSTYRYHLYLAYVECAVCGHRVE